VLIFGMFNFKFGVMKKVTLLLSFLFWLFSTIAMGQWYNINFDTINGLDHLYIDTVHYHNNIWQIGKPHKTGFISAYSAPNAIITDTLHPYPKNDTSVFIITNFAEGGYAGHDNATFSGWYFVNSDTLSDYGKIEFSPNNGNTWINLLKDTIPINYMGQNFNWYWSFQGGSPPVLSGNSRGWVQFGTNLAWLGLAFGINWGDTILFRFTFISDSNQTNKDGLMFDDFNFVDYIEGIPEFSNNIHISIFPNPFSTTSQITLSKTYHNILLSVYDIQGKLVSQNQYKYSDKITLNRNGLNNGMYFLKLILDDKEIATGKVVVSD